MRITRKTQYTVGKKKTDKMHTWYRHVRSRQKTLLSSNYFTRAHPFSFLFHNNNQFQQ